MNDWLEGIVRERAELFEFALDAMAWVERPTVSGRELLVRRARKLATITNHPKPFARFATWLVEQDEPDGSETR